MTTGSRSQFALTRLASSYNRMMKDGRVLSNRQSLEIVRRRIEQLAERIDINDAPDRMEKINELWIKYTGLLDRDQHTEAHLTRKELDEEFEKAYHDYAAWKQMFEALDLHRTLVESEVKIAKDMHAILTAEDAYEMIAQIFAIILRIEDSPKKLKRYQYELTRLIGEGSVIEAEASDPDDRDPGGPDPVDREEFLYSRDEE